MLYHMPCNYFSQQDVPFCFLDNRTNIHFDLFGNRKTRRCRVYEACYISIIVFFNCIIRVDFNLVCQKAKLLCEINWRPTGIQRQKLGTSGNVLSKENIAIVFLASSRVLITTSSVAFHVRKLV